MQTPKLKIVYMGTPDFAVSSLDALCHSQHQVVGVVTVPDRQTGRGLKVTYSPVKQYALDHEIPLLQPEKLRDPQFLEQLRQLEADLFVVVAFRMLPREVWSMPRLGTFNLHASLLPQYRGAAPLNWAIINGEHESGITTFLLNERIDEGQILLQQTTPISDEDTVETLHDRLAEMGKQLVLQTVDGLAAGTLTPHPQCLDGVELKPAPKIFKEDCLIPWHKPGTQIVNFVRGLSPYPAAMFRMTDSKHQMQQFKVFQVRHEKASDQEFQMAVGTVVSDGKKYLKVKVCDGFIHILSLQMNGKRRNNIEEFLRGFDVSGCVLGL